MLDKAYSKAESNQLRACLKNAKVCSRRRKEAEFLGQTRFCVRLFTSAATILSGRLRGNDEGDIQGFGFCGLAFTGGRGDCRQCGFLRVYERLFHSTAGGRL